MTNRSTYERVSEWNERCSNTPSEVGTDEYWKSLSNQAERIKEELDELTEAIENKDTIEAFDALLDLDVVVAGGLYLSNGDYTGGITAVLDNNDLKYTGHRLLLANATTQLAHEPEAIHVEVSPQGWYSIHRDSDNKVMKFPGHPKVNLEPYAPKEGSK